MYARRSAGLRAASAHRPGLSPSHAAIHRSRASAIAGCRRAQGSTHGCRATATSVAVAGRSGGAHGPTHHRRALPAPSTAAAPSRGSPPPPGGAASRSRLMHPPCPTRPPRRPGEGRRTRAARPSRRRTRWPLLPPPAVLAPFGAPGEPVRAGPPRRGPGRSHRPTGAGRARRHRRLRRRRRRARRRVGSARRRPAHHLRAARADRPRRVRSWRQARCSAPSWRAIAAARRPACTGACGATGWSTSIRSSCSARCGCACSRYPIRGRTREVEVFGQTRASSSSRPRSRPTRRACNWHTRDSVTPSIRPISASVRFSR